MIIPSSMNLKFKFPEFVSINDTSVEFAIEEAVIACAEWPAGSADGWINDANQTVAIMYYAAHLLQMSIMRAGSGTGQIISSERIGELSMTYAVPTQNQNQTNDLMMTRYGVRFLELVKSNFPAVLTIGSAVRM